MPREHHRRRSSRDSSRRRNRRRSREFYYSNPAAPSASRAAADSAYPTSHARLNRRGSRSSLSSSSSSSSSYMDISRSTPPRRSGNVFTTFFTAPSEHRRRTRRRARTRILPFGNSSSSSLDSDLAYGTGFIRRPRGSQRDTYHAQPQQHHRDDYRQTAPQYQWDGTQHAQHDPRYPQPAAPQAHPYSQQPHDPRYQPSRDDPAYSQYYPQPPADSREPQIHAESSSATPTAFAGPVIGAGLGLAAASALSGRENRDDRPTRDRDSDRRDGRGRRPPRGDRDDQLTSSAADSNATPRPARLQRRSTDEEIMHLGRELTRLHSDIDSRPTGLVAGGSKRNRDRGIGSSRPYEGPYSSDDESGEWESVSSQSSKEDFLAYGSTVSFPQAPHRPTEQPTPEAPHPDFTRASTFVDPRNFGPQNSLNGFVSPRPPSTHPRSSAPMQQVDAVPMGDERGFILPSTQVYPKLSRPTDVRLEQPTPVAPVSPERLERSSYYEKPDRKVSGGRDRKSSSGGKVLTGAALATAAGVVGHTILSNEKGKDERRAHAEDKPVLDDHSEYAKRDRRAAEEQERMDEEERRKKQLDAEYEEYLESMKRRSGDRSRRTKHGDAGLPRESRREASGNAKEPREFRDTVDQPRLPSSHTKPTGDYFDYRRFQVPDDAFRTPTYSRHATPDRTKEVVPEAPRIFTIDREPSFSPPRLSRKDSFEMEKMAEEVRKSSHDRFEEEEAELKRAYEDAKRRAMAGNSSDIIPASYADEDPTRGRSSTKDPVLEEADEFYRKSRRSAAEEIRSRSASPDHSVVGKWQEQDSGKFIVSTPSSEHHDPPNPFSGPHADVRVDTIFDHPEHLTRFLENRARSASKGQHLPGTRDPSADRERPLLNIVRPTPVPSPSVEERDERQKSRSAKSRSRSRSQTRSREVEQDQSETAAVKEVSPANIVIGPRGEVIDLIEEQPSEKKADVPTPVADRSLEDFETPGTLVRTAWGAVNTDIASKFDDSASDKGRLAGEVVANDDREIDLVDEEPVARMREFDATHSDFLPERDDPSRPEFQPESKPSSSKVEGMPGSFGDDLEFAATIGAGLKAAGFDDTIASDDPQYRRRDSPPGSHDELGAASRDAPLVIEAQPEGHEWGTSHKGKKKKKKTSGMPGSFGEDLEFAATIGAGLKAAGFDDTIATNDPQYQRRDSPPGSNDELGATSRDTPLVIEAQPEGYEWGTSLKGKKKNKKAKKQKGTSEPEVDLTRASKEEEPFQPIEIVDPVDSRRRSISPEHIRDRSRRRSISPERGRDRSTRRSASPERARDRSRRRSASPERAKDRPRRHSISPGRASDRSTRRSASPERARDRPRRHSISPGRARDRSTRRSASPERARDRSAGPTEHGEPAETPSPAVEDSQPPPKKLSKKERKLLAKRAAESQSQENQLASAAPSKVPIVQDATEESRLPEERSRDLPATQLDEIDRASPADDAGEPAAILEAGPDSERVSPSHDDISPTEEDVSLKKLSKKERKLLAKKKAAESQIHDNISTPAIPGDGVDEEVAESPRGPIGEGSRELPANEDSCEPPFDDGSHDILSENLGERAALSEDSPLPKEDTLPLDDVPPPEDHISAKKLSKKERKLLAKQKAAEAQLQSELAPVTPSDRGVREAPVDDGPPELPSEKLSEQPAASQDSPLSKEDAPSLDDVPPPEDDIPAKKLTKKEQRKLAKKEAAEAQLQDEQAPAISGDGVDKESLVDESSRELPSKELSEQPAALEGSSPPKEDAVPFDDAPAPENDLPTKKLTKKEQRKLAKKKAAEAQLQDEPAPATPSDVAIQESIEQSPAVIEESSRELPGEMSEPPPMSGDALVKNDPSLPTEDVSREEDGSSKESIPPAEEDASQSRDDVPLPEDDIPSKKLTKKELRKLAKKQKASQLDEVLAQEPPTDDSARLREIEPVSEKLERVQERDGSPPAEGVSSPTADDDVWHEAVEEAPLVEDEMSKDAPILADDESTRQEAPTVQEESFAVPSKKKKKKKKASASLDIALDKPADELPSDDLPKDDLPKDDLPKDDLPKDDLPKDDLPKDDLPKDDLPKDDLPKDDLPKDGFPEQEAPQPSLEEAIWATPTKKSKKGKKKGRKLDDSTNPEPPDKGQTNGHHTNGHEQAKSDGIGEDSFLARAGTPGEGVGVPGAAAAVVAASAALSGSHATDSPSEQKENPGDSDRGVGPDSREISGLGEGSQAVDPDVVPRQVKYVIDPQHGDLLSLPPSTPPSPGGSVDDNLPQLPDSRPDTPPEEAYKRELLKSRRRKSTQDSPHARSTSETSIPLPLLLGQRSNPSSPRFVRPSPTGSPVSPAADRKSFSRPISWDGKKDIRPLILPTRQGNESPSRSISPLKDLQQRELGDPPAIGLGVSDPKSHVDSNSGVAADDSLRAGESAERDVPTVQPGIDSSTPTKKKKGKGRATADDLARPDPDSALADSQIQDLIPSWEDGFDVPAVSKGESGDSSLEESDKLVPEEPSAATEPGKSIDVVPILEPEVTESEPVVKVEKSLQSQPDNLKEEPVMTKAERKKAKKKKKASQSPWDDVLTSESGKSADEKLVKQHPIEIPVDPEKAADEGPQEQQPIEPPVESSSQSVADAATDVPSSDIARGGEFERSIGPPQEEPVPTTKGKKTKKKKKGSQYLGVDASTSGPIPSEQTSEEKQIDPPIPVESTVDGPGDYVPDPPSQEAETPPVPEEMSIGSTGEVESSGTRQPEQAAVQDPTPVLAFKPTDAKEPELTESTSSEPPRDDLVLPVSGKKKKKKKKSSVSEEATSSGPVGFQEQGSGSAQVSEGPGQASAENLTSINSEEGEEEKGSEVVEDIQSSRSPGEPESSTPVMPQEQPFTLLEVSKMPEETTADDPASIDLKKGDDEKGSEALDDSKISPPPAELETQLEDVITERSASEDREPVLSGQDDQASPAVLNTGESEDAVPEQDIHPQTTTPKTPASDDIPLEDGLAGTMVEDLSTAPTGKKGKKAKKGKKKGGSVDESSIPKASSATDTGIESKPVDSLVSTDESVSHSPEQLSGTPVEIAESHKESSEAPEQLPESVEQSQSLEQSAPDTTTGAEESSSTVLESVLSGKKGKKKKKKSVSFADLPPEPTASSTVSPMPEMEDYIADAPLKTGALSDRELVQSLDEARDGAGGSVSPESPPAPSKELLSEAAPSSDTPVSESELSLSPKSKKKKKKGKAVEDLISNSDADVSAPPTPVEEPQEFPPAEGVSETVPVPQDVTPASGDVEAQPGADLVVTTDTTPTDDGTSTSVTKKGKKKKKKKGSSTPEPEPEPESESTSKLVSAMESEPSVPADVSPPEPLAEETPTEPISAEDPSTSREIGPERLPEPGTSETVELERLPKSQPSETVEPAASAPEPDLQGDDPSAAPLSKKERKKKKKKGKSASEPEPASESIEQPQLLALSEERDQGSGFVEPAPGDSAMNTEPEPESESVEQQALREATATEEREPGPGSEEQAPESSAASETRELRPGPAEQAPGDSAVIDEPTLVREVEESRETQDDTLSFAPMSKKEKKKRKKARAALQQDSSMEVEPNLAPLTPAEGEMAGEETRPVTPEVVESPDTQVAQEHGTVPDVGSKSPPAFESPVDAEQSAPERSEPPSPTEVPAPDPAPILEESPASVEIRVPESIPEESLVQERSTSPDRAEEPTVGEDESSQAPLSKKEKKKKKRAKSKAGATSESLRQADSESTPTATSSDDIPKADPTPASQEPAEPTVPAEETSIEQPFKTPQAVERAPESGELSEFAATPDDVRPSQFSSEPVLEESTRDATVEDELSASKDNKEKELVIEGSSLSASTPVQEGEWDLPTKKKKKKKKGKKGVSLETLTSPVEDEGTEERVSEGSPIQSQSAEKDTDNSPSSETPDREPATMDDVPESQIPAMSEVDAIIEEPTTPHTEAQDSSLAVDDERQAISTSGNDISLFPTTGKPTQETPGRDSTTAGGVAETEIPVVDVDDMAGPSSQVEDAAINETGSTTSPDDLGLGSEPSPPLADQLPEGSHPLEPSGSAQEPSPIENVAVPSSNKKDKKKKKKKNKKSMTSLELGAEDAVDDSGALDRAASETPLTPGIEQTDQLGDTSKDILKERLSEPEPSLTLEVEEPSVDKQEPVPETTAPDIQGAEPDEWASPSKKSKGKKGKKKRGKSTSTTTTPAPSRPDSPVREPAVSLGSQQDDAILDGQPGDVVLGSRPEDVVLSSQPEDAVSDEQPGDIALDRPEGDGLVGRQLGDVSLDEQRGHDVLGGQRGDDSVDGQPGDVSIAESAKDGADQPETDLEGATEPLESDHLSRGSYGEGAPETILESSSHAQTPGEADHLPREPSAEITIPEDSGIQDVNPVHEDPEIRRELSLTPAEPAPEAVSVETPAGPGQSSPEPSRSGKSDLPDIRPDSPKPDEPAAPVEEWAPTSKKKKGKKGKKRASETIPAISRPEPPAMETRPTAGSRPQSPAAGDGDRTPAVSRPPSPATRDPEPMVEGVEELEPPKNWIPAESKTINMGVTDPTEAGRDPSILESGKHKALDDTHLEDVSQPRSPLNEEPPPQAAVEDSDSWGIPTKKKKKGKKVEGKADPPPDGAGLGLFRPASPARDDTLQPFRAGSQGETDVRSRDFSVETESRADTSETREFSAASDDRRAGGAEGQDATGGDREIAQPLPSADEETPTDLHDAVGSGPVAAQFESGGDAVLLGQDNTDWGSTSTKKKSRKGEGMGAHVNDIPGASIPPSAAADENTRFSAESIVSDTSISNKPDLPVSLEPGLEPVPQEERHESDPHVTLEPGADPNIQPEVQREIPSEISAQIESSIQQSEVQRETQPATREEAIKEPDAIVTPEAENTELAAEPSTSHGPSKPETESDVGHKAHVPTEDPPLGGLNVSKKKGKKGKKKGKSTSATPVVSRPLTPVDEDRPAPLSESRALLELNIQAPNSETEVASNEPGVSEQAPDDWDMAPKKKKGKKRDRSLHPSSPTICRPASPITDEPTKDPEPTPNETAGPSMSRPMSPIADEPSRDLGHAQMETVCPPMSRPMTPIECSGDQENTSGQTVPADGAEELDFTTKNKKGKKRDQSSSIITSTSRPVSPVIDEPDQNQGVIEDQGGRAQGDAESVVPASEGVEDWGFTTKKKGKKSKKQAPPASDVTNRAVSRDASPSRAISPPHAASPSRTITEAESLLLASNEPQPADERDLSNKKKGKKKDKKTKTEHSALEQLALDREERHSRPEERDSRSPGPALKTHLTPAQATSHITHDAPSEEAVRPEKKVKTEEADSLMLSEHTLPVQEQPRETRTFEQPTRSSDDSGNINDVPVESEERQHSPRLDKGKGLDRPFTRDVDDTHLETSSNLGETKGVEALTDKFDGQVSKSKKKGKKKKMVDRRTEREEDLFDDPLLWESPDKKTLTAEEKIVDEQGFWDYDKGAMGSGERSLRVTDPTMGEAGMEMVDDSYLRSAEVAKEAGDVVMSMAEKASPDESTIRSGQGEETSVVVEESAMDVERTIPVVERDVLEGKRTRERIEEDFPEEARHSHKVEDRQTLESKREVETKMEDRRTSPVTQERGIPMADVTEHPRSTQGNKGVTRLERTWDELGESPILGRGETQDPRTTTEETTHIPPVTPTRDLTPTLDESPYAPLRQSLSRNLEPVPEEEPETFGSPTQSRERRSRKLPSLTDMNRDSGFATNSPRLGQRSQWQQEGPHRDSGVHLKDWAESPRHVSPEPSTSRSKDVFKTPEPSERRLKRSPRSAKDLREHEHPVSKTPVFREPSPHAPTPEPQKSLRDYKTPDTPRSRYHDLETPSLSAKRPSISRLGHAAPLPRSNTNSPIPGQRSVSDNTSRQTPSPDVAPRRVASNTSLTRHRTPEPKLRPDTPGSIRSLHSATPPLRRAGRRISGDLRSISLSQRSQAEAPPSAESSDEHRSAQNSTPVANEGRVRSKDMTDVYDGFGEGRIGSPRSPTRPHSMRRRQSMQVIELESQVNDLLAQNMLLQQERQQYADQPNTKKAQALLADRDAEIDVLKRSIEQLNREVSRLIEVNEGLNAANTQLSNDQNSRYRDLELLHAEASRELETTRTTQDTFDQRLQDKDAEIAGLREELEEAKAKIEEMQEKILETSRPADADFLDLRDVDYFDRRCQQLCQHAQQWVLRFSKFSDMRSCRLTSEINDEKIIDRLDNTILDGSDVDKYLRDRVRRRDIFMSMTMNMIWEFVFTRYLFGMDREQRQKLKSLEKHLTEVGPPNAVRQWRAVTLTLLSRRPSFQRQRELDSEAVVQAILSTLSLILPPPTHLEDQIQSTLRRVMKEAVDLAVAMRTQRAEYMMLPPLEPKYDADGELAETVTFNKSLMSERSGDRSLDPAELEAQAATVRIVLFPLVVRRGDEAGVGDDEVVVCPAQVLIARSRRKSRGVTPSDLGGAPVGGSAQDLAPSEFLGTELSRLE